MLEFNNLCIDSTSDGRLMGNVVVSDFVIEVGNETANGGSFNMSKWLQMN